MKDLIWEWKGESESISKKMENTERDKKDKMNNTIRIYSKKVFKGVMVSRDDINETRKGI